MSAPASVNARSSVEIKNSCNSCCCPWPKGKKKHHKRDSCDKVVQEVKDIATLQAIPSNSLRQPQVIVAAPLQNTDAPRYQLMPTPASVDVTRVAEGSGK